MKAGGETAPGLRRTQGGTCFNHIKGRTGIPGLLSVVPCLPTATSSFISLGTVVTRAFILSSRDRETEVGSSRGQRDGGQHSRTPLCQALDQGQRDRGNTCVVGLSILRTYFELRVYDVYN